mmetsp:Transcript_19289/g.34434  ORF Transcript_19289/g.34434 Transcript_19289/m.34434 type:complete len:472 (-) Transcript_19289:19-1434(-)
MAEEEKDKPKPHTSTPEELAMVEAAKKGDFAKLKSMFDEIPSLDADARDADGETALMWAAGRGWLKIVKHLVLERNANVELFDVWGFNALMLAAQCGKLEVVKFLVHCGARLDLRCTGNDGRGAKTARQLAAEKGEKGVCAYLLQKERENFVFSGMFPAVVTEFEEKTQKLVIKNIGAYARHLAQSGCKGVFICGTTGESMTMSETERKAVVEAWVHARNALKLPLVIITQVGCESLPAACSLASHAEAVGVDAIACMVPAFFKPKTCNEAVAFNQKVAESAPGTHFLFYHIPSMTGGKMNASEFLKEARPRIPTLSGIKFTSGDLHDYATMCELDPENKLAFLPGLEIIYTSFSAYNSATGRRFSAVSSMANIHARLFNKLFSIAESDEFRPSVKYKQLESLSAIIRRLFRLYNKHDWISVVKLALKDMGIIVSTTQRLPNVSLAKDQEDPVREELKAIASLVSLQCGKN